MTAEQFLKDNVEIRMGEYITKKELYDSYKQWGIEKQCWSISASQFSTAVFAMFKQYTPKRTSINGVRIWRNIRLVTRAN